MRLGHPAMVRGGAVMVIATLGLLVNVVAFAILSGGEQNLNVRGALAHVLGDLLGSAAALLAGALIWWRGWMIADPLLSAFVRSEEHTSELQSLMRISYAVFCLKKKTAIHVQYAYKRRTI